VKEGGPLRGSEGARAAWSGSGFEKAGWLRLPAGSSTLTGCPPVVMFSITGSSRRFMKKFLLLSIILAAIAIPARNSKVKNARAGLRKTLIHTLAFNLVYLFLILYVWHRI
jgi:hypothetical protein